MGFFVSRNFIELMLPLLCGVLSSLLTRPFYAAFLRGLFTLCFVPAFLVLHGAEVAQARMQSTVIVEGHPVHDDLPCLLPGSEALSMHTSVLQSSPEAFNGGVVIASAIG